MQAFRNPPSRARALAVLLLSSGIGCRSVPPVQHPASEAPCAGDGCVGWTSWFLSGGRGPGDNAVAHEKNLSFAGRSLKLLGVENEGVFFADGEATGADLQQEEPDPVRRRRLFALGLLWDPEVDIHDTTLIFRDHQIPGAQAADHRTVLRGLASSAVEARRKAPGDLLLYVTDHGVRREDETNNVIVLWGDRDLSVRELGAALDEQPPTRRVVSVMAQCFSGSFAGLIHQGGNPGAALAEHDRCGFFAVPPDRPAAGCSPRDEEALYDDYTTRFFAALAGQDRQGQPVASADADGDGRVSYEEAHFAAIARERTQDIPVSSSEELLRRRLARWIFSEESTAYERLLSGARPALRKAAEELLAAASVPRKVTLGRLRKDIEALQDRCWPGLCEADEQLTEAQQKAHDALVRAAGSEVRRTEGAAGVLALAGDAAVDRWIAAAQPHFDEVLRLDARVEVLQVEAETHEARLRRLVRMGELQILERQAFREGGALWSAYQRVRRCEVSGPWARRR